MNAQLLVDWSWPGEEHDGTVPPLVFPREPGESMDRFTVVAPDPEFGVQQVFFLKARDVEHVTMLFPDAAVLDGWQGVEQGFVRKDVRIEYSSAGEPRLVTR